MANDSCKRVQTPARSLADRRRRAPGFDPAQAEGRLALVHQQLGNPPKVNLSMAGKPVVAHTRNKNRTIESIYDILHARLAEPRSGAAGEAAPPAPAMPIAASQPELPGR